MVVFVEPAALGRGRQADRMIPETPDYPFWNQRLAPAAGTGVNHPVPAGIRALKHEEILSLEGSLAAGAEARNRETATVTEHTGEELEWVERARKSDTHAFEQLYRLHVDRVYGLCLRMTGNVSEAEDCTQEAFIQAWTQLDKFRAESSFGTWMHRVAVNVVLGRMRRSRREQDRIRAVSDVAPAPTAVGDSGGLQDLEKAMDELPSGARHVFVLYAVYGYSHEETSEMLGIASGTSKAQLHRARRLLAQQLNTGMH
jgi:RNA polymerase sigma-70 factor (ECF subfamily)